MNKPETVTEAKTATLIRAAVAHLAHQRAQAGAIPVPDTSPQQFVAIGTPDEIAVLLRPDDAPATAASHPARRQRRGDRPTEPLQWEGDAPAATWGDAPADLSPDDVVDWDFLGNPITRGRVDELAKMKAAGIESAAAPAPTTPFAWMKPNEIDGLLKATDKATSQGEPVRQYGRIYARQYDADMVPVCAAASASIKLEDIEQYRLQMAAIGTAALGYWKESDGIKPEYDTVPLRDVAKLYAKYEALASAAAPAPSEDNLRMAEAKIRAAMCCHPNAVETLLGEALDALSEQTKNRTPYAYTYVHIDGRRDWRMASSRRKPEEFWTETALYEAAAPATASGDELPPLPPVYGGILDEAGVHKYASDYARAAVSAATKPAPLNLSALSNVVANAYIGQTGEHLDAAIAQAIAKDVLSLLATKPAVAPEGRKVTYVPRRGKKGAAQVTAWGPFDMVLPDHTRIVEDVALYAAPTAAPAEQVRDLAYEHAAHLCDNKHEARAAAGVAREASTARALAAEIRALKSAPDRAQGEGNA